MLFFCEAFNAYLGATYDACNPLRFKVIHLSN